MHRTVLTAALLLATTTAFANQSVTLSPVISTLTPTTRVATVNIANNTGCAAAFQFSVSRWTQKDGKDVDAPTTAVRAVPALITIPSGATQIVRVARMAPPNTTSEEAYRLDIQQQGSCPTKQGDGPTLKIRYHLEAPIFYRNPAWKPDLHAVWSNGGLKLRNDGKATADVYGVTAGNQAWVAHAIHIQPGSAVDVVPKKGAATKPTVIDVRTGPKVTAHLTVE
jgi:P pilus assembly chaperone PapD